MVMLFVVMTMFVVMPVVMVVTVLMFVRAAVGFVMVNHYAY
jgi:hypothetical protein